MRTKGKFQTMAQVTDQVKRWESKAVDLLVTSKDIRYAGEGNLKVPPSLTSDLFAKVNHVQKLPATRDALAQLSSRLKVPAHWLLDEGKVSERLRKQVLAQRLEEEEASEWLIRTHGGKIRAVLSGSYRPYSHLNLLEDVSEALGGMQLMEHAKLFKTSVNDKFTTMITFPELLKPVNHSTGGYDDKGTGGLMAGVYCTNSEVGDGSVFLQASLFRLVCSNGLIVSTEEFQPFRRVHVSISHSAGIKSEVQEAISGIFNHGDKALNKFIDLQGRMIKRGLEQSIEDYRQSFRLPQEFASQWLAALTANSKERTAWDVINVATELAQTEQFVQIEEQVSPMAGDLLSEYAS